VDLPEKGEMARPRYLMVCSQACFADKWIFGFAISLLSFDGFEK
jgi:hypothetical protein